MRRPRNAGLVVVGMLLAGLSGAGCSSSTPEEDAEALKKRMIDIEKKVKDSMPKTQEIALKQKVDPEVLKKVQEELGVLKEYLDEPTGKMDFVTVNAIQAFQRRVELKDDGLLDEKTLARLEEEAKKAKASQG
jgi:peptidoglycan hydrolase-like protein with peptidoglycan-binding domain